jgi:hypothetical protein
LPPIKDTELETKQLGDRVSEDELSFYQKIRSDLPKLNITSIMEIVVADSDTVTLMLDENTHALADKAHIDSELQLLQSVLLSQAFDRRGKTIDLRFENPVTK